MTDKDFEKQLREKFEKATPNNLEQIMKKCESQSPEETAFAIPKKNKNKFLQRFVGIAAALILCFAIGIAAFISLNQNAYGSTIALDVNPGIEIMLNKQSKVMSITATNDDGKAILNELDIKGKALEVAIDEIIKTLVSEGYISENANSVLISVSADKQDLATSLESIITEQITKTLSGKGLNASVLTQVIDKTEEIEKLANEYGMSEGKARLIDELVRKDGRHTFEELSTLTVSELSLLLRDTNLMPSDVKSHGEISKKPYITEQKAIEIALERAGLKLSDVTEAHAELDYFKKHGDKNGAMTYYVKFFLGEKVYKFDVDARSGKILRQKVEEGATPPPSHDFDGGDKKPPYENGGDGMDNDGNDYNSDNGYAPPTSDGDRRRPSNMIGKEGAIEAARKAGFNPESVDDFDTEIERDHNGNWYYEIEFSENGQNEKIRIDAKTGEIIKPKN